MKKRLLFVLFVLACFNLPAQDRYIYQDTTQYYSFRINYWFNLHHFLWLESFVNTNADSTIINQQLPEESQKILSEALTYYQQKLTAEDLRESDYMTEFKVWVTHQGKELKAIPDKFEEHVSILQTMSEVYEANFWAAHQSSCKRMKIST